MSAEPPLRWRVSEHAFPSARPATRPDAPGPDSYSPGAHGPGAHRLDADRLDLPDGFDVVAAVEDELTPSRRADGWTPGRQRDFLAALAEGQTVEGACRIVGLTHQSAYAFRQRTAGATFAIGWYAALLLQRQRLADTLTSRAFDGQVDTVTRDDGTTVRRHRFDNRLALALLARLDRLAAADAAGADPKAAAPGEAEAARLVAQDWERWLDLVDAGAGPARAGLFLAARARTAAGEDGAVAALAPIVALARADLHARTGVTDAGELATDDLDPAERAGWTAEQWARAEAAGLLALVAPPAPKAPPAQPKTAPAPAHKPQVPQHSPAAAGEEEEELEQFYIIDQHPQIWWEESRMDWRTSFPPPDGFLGDEDGEPADEAYCRSLAEDEEALIEALQAHERAVLIEEGLRGREAWLAELAQAVARIGSADDAAATMAPGLSPELHETG